MFLTRLEINPARRGAKMLLGSPQKMHSAVLASYPSSRTLHGGRVLWRVDRSGSHYWLFVVGPNEPDMTHLVEQAGWPTTATWETKPYHLLLDRLVKGGHWAFRLTANPTHAKRIGNSTRSQRVAHVTVAQQLQWFTDRISTWGIQLRQSAAGPMVVLRDRRVWQFNRDGRRVTLSVATFEGELIIEDPDLARSALTLGIGPAKAYGCGLMTLAPVRGT